MCYTLKLKKVVLILQYSYFIKVYTYYGFDMIHFLNTTDQN